jgi:ribosomal protein L33
MKRTIFFSRSLVQALAVVVMMGVWPAPKMQALSGNEFNAGNIIDDATFTYKDAVSVQDIQNFLNSKVPTCDTAGNGTFTGTYKGVYYNGILRKNLDPAFPPPYTCLRNYAENPTTHENNLGGAMPAGAISAAQIIFNAAQAYTINPRVLIVLLQKESSLVTDDWPWSNQYRTATGYGCPDGQPCDSQYYGFANQVSKAAFQFRRYYTYPAQYNYQPNRNNNILYNPNAGCGYRTVYIENQATASLYNYTPYTPNQAALNNLYGTGDGCSSYGNRNFWRLFTDWFGSAQGNTPTGFTLRMVNKRGYHFYSNVPSEQFIAITKVGYRTEIPAGYNVNVAQVEGSVPVYRMVHPLTGDHFYTTSTNERDTAINIVRYKDEGVAYYVMPAAGSGLVPVYRLVHPLTGDHFYTTSTNERDTAINIVRYKDEGVAFYVTPQ